MRIASHSVYSNNFMCQSIRRNGNENTPFLSFVIFCVLEIFKGTITMSMNESMEEMKSETESAKKASLIRRNKSRVYKLSLKHKTRPGSESGSSSADVTSMHKPSSFFMLSQMTDGMRVLIVDTSTFKDLVVNELEKCKFEVVTARSGVEAFDILKASKVPFDFVLMEVVRLI